MREQVIDRRRFGTKRRKGICAKGQRVESKDNLAAS